MTGSGPVHPTPRGARIDLRVIPRSSRTGVEGIRNGRVLLRVAAPPVDNAANDAVLAVLADVLGVAKRLGRLVSGATARNKTVDVDGVDVEDVRARLGQSETAVRRASGRD